MKITILSKPEAKTSGKGTKYWTLKVKDETGQEKSGSFFSKTEPQIDQEIEVEEKYNEQYANYSWFVKEERKQGGGFIPKPGLSIEQQIRVIALQEAVKRSPVTSSSKDVAAVAVYFETYIKEGKI